MRFSASRLDTWMTCPLQAHFQYDLELPRLQHSKASFGTCIHHSLALYNETGNIKLAIERFKDHWQNPEKLGVVPDIWTKFTSFGELRNRGIEILEHYHDSMKWDKREVIAVEHKFLVPFGRHELTGFVDLIELRKSGNGKELLKIVDHKTSSRSPNIAELRLNVQFTTYMYASLQPEFWMGNGEDFPGIPNGKWLYEMHKDTPRRAIWNHLWTMREIDAGPRVEADFARLYRVTDEIEKAVQAQVHVPKIGSACSLCSFTKECGLTIPSKEEMREEENAWI